MKNLQFLVFILLLGLSFTQCVDQEFDVPPLDGPTVNVPDEAVVTIESIMENFSMSNPFKLEAGTYLRGVVVGSDKSGNIFKTLFIQDETAGIAVIIDETDLFNTYYVGREVYVKLDDLYLGDFAELPQIGMAPVGEDVSRIPSSLLGDIVLPGAYNVSVEPTEILIGDVSNQLLNTLVQINNVEFAASELGSTYATAIPASNIFQTENRTIVNCDGVDLVLRSSGFSEFANTPLPNGNGTIYAILGRFGDSYQLVIRDLGDVQFDGDRCDGSTGGGGGTDPVDIDDADVISINSVLSTFAIGESVALTQGKYFKATVTADDRSGNIFKQLFIADDSDAILISLDRFDLFQDYPVGSEVYIKLDGLHIGDFAGLPQIGINASGGEVNRIPESQIASTVIATNTTQSVSPRDIQFSDINDDLLNHLVRLSDVQVIDSSLGDTYADASGPSSLNHTIESCDGDNIIMRSSGFADFANSQLPEGNGSITAVLTKFGDNYQIVIRDLTDVSLTAMRCDGSGGGGGGGDPEAGTINEDFESGNNNDAVNLTGWSNIATQGDRTWQFKEFDGNLYAQATAFGDDAAVMETYLVTPELDFDEVTTMSFVSAQAFYTHGGLEVLYSSNYNGNADSATWETINATIADSGSTEHAWISSGDVDISGFSGSGHIAFKYTGSAPAGDTNSMRIDDVIIE